MSAPLPQVFLERPIAHRGLHGPGVPENSLAAIRAAVEAGYGIEIDIQHAAGGEPVVFHDYDLERMVGAEGYVADTSVEDLVKIKLANTDECIPTLAEALREVAGRAPLLIEIKDQDGRLGNNIGDLQNNVAEALNGYDGPVAVISFNPYTVAAFIEAAPEIAAGLTGCGFIEDEWPMLDDETREQMARLEDFESSGASFLAHDARDIDNAAVRALKAQGVPILAWAVNSPEDEARVRQIADNIEFEGYEPGIG